MHKNPNTDRVPDCGYLNAEQLETYSCYGPSPHKQWVKRSLRRTLRRRWTQWKQRGLLHLIE